MAASCSAPSNKFFRTQYELTYQQQRPNGKSPNHSNSSSAVDGAVREHRLSLPPIYNITTQNQREGREETFSKEEEEGETSGYASDSGGVNEYQPPNTNQEENTVWQNNERVTPEGYCPFGFGVKSEEGRARWGDRGVGVGHFWAPTPHLPEARLPQVTTARTPATPAWLQRGLNKISEPVQVLVINHPDEERLSTANTSNNYLRCCDSLNSTDCNTRSFIRGQNVRVEPEELEEREKKRLKALQLQNAIRQQLEERDRKRKEEKERRHREERQEEERLRRQHELERRRIKEEEARQKDKEEKEERKQKAMREALENAERNAKEEKLRIRSKHVTEISESLNCLHLGAEVQQRNPDPKEMAIENEDTFGKQDESTNCDTVRAERRDYGNMTPLLTPQESVANQRALFVSTSPGCGRLLTPSKFRMRNRRLTEKATQTEQCKSNQHRCKLPLRCRVQKPLLRLEERPKWGVNVPHSQYIRQSDRDPVRRVRPLHRLRIREHSKQSNDSRSPSPLAQSLNQSKASFLNGSSNSFNKSGATSITYNIAGPSKLLGRMMPDLGTSRAMANGRVRKTSAGRPRYLSVKGGIGAFMNGTSSKLRTTNRIQLSSDMPTEQFVDNKCEMHSTKTEKFSFDDVLDHLTSLREGLAMKKQEWQSPRSQTPFSEISSQS